MPAALSAAIERLRRDRMPVQLVRSAEEAAEAVDAFDRILLIGDGAICRPRSSSGSRASEGAAVLTVPEGAMASFTSGSTPGRAGPALAAIDGALLRETAGMLRDWDLQSTLLRRTLQAGAGHVAADSAARSRSSTATRIWTSSSGGSSPAPTTPTAAGPITCSRRSSGSAPPC